MMVSMMNWWTTPKTRRKAGGWERPVSPRETIIGIGIGIGIQTEKSGYNPTITPYHDQPLYSLQCHDLTACGARCIRILELLLDFELRRTVEEPKNQKTSFPGFWFPGPGNRCQVPGCFRGLQKHQGASFEGSVRILCHGIAEKKEVGHGME